MGISECTITETLNVLAPQELRAIGPDNLTLHQLDRICESLVRDVRWITDEFRALRSADAVPRYCLDYDVLFPTIEAIRDDQDASTEGGFWSSLVLDLQGFQIILLPGTLYEILSYTQSRLDAVKKVSETKIGSAFIAHVAQLNFNKISETQGKLLEVFRNAVISEEDFYLSSVIKHRAKLVEAPLPLINRNLFYQCIVQLSQGSRINKILNNRVDAYNYALVAALNDQPQSKYRYLLVSTSSHVANLDTHAWHRIGADSSLSKLQYRRAVISPRRAAIFQLLAVAGGGIGVQSAQLAWELQAALREWQQKISRRISDANHEAHIPIARLKEIRSDNVFLELISSFAAIQKRFADAHRLRQESIEIFARKYDLHNPIAFFQELIEAISTILRNRGYRDALREEIPTKAVKLTLKEQKKDSRFNYQKHVNAIGADGELAFSFFGYTNNHLFVSRGKCSLDAFISLYNAIVSDVYAKITAKLYDGWKEQKATGFVVGASDGLIERSLDNLPTPLQSSELLSLFSPSEVKINFIRINHPWFEMSYEDTAFVFSTPFPMVDEISLFLQETAKVGNRGVNYRALVGQLLSAAP
jgi:hypothetical protein